MKVIKTIDLWTEQKIDHYECFNGCFVDGGGVKMDCRFQDMK